MNIHSIFLLVVVVVVASVTVISSLHYRTMAPTFIVGNVVVAVTSAPTITTKTTAISSLSSMTIRNAFKMRIQQQQQRSQIVQKMASIINNGGVNLQCRQRQQQQQQQQQQPYQHNIVLSFITQTKHNIHNNNDQYHQQRHHQQQQQQYQSFQLSFYHHVVQYQQQQQSKQQQQRRLLFRHYSSSSTSTNNDSISSSYQDSIKLSGKNNNKIKSKNKNKNSTSSNTVNNNLNNNNKDDNDEKEIEDDTTYEIEDDTTYGIEPNSINNATTSTNDNYTNEYATTYHAPVMWKECIVALLQSQRSKDRLRTNYNHVHQQQEQPEQSQLKEQPSQINTSINDDDDSDGIVQNTLTTTTTTTTTTSSSDKRNENQLNRERSRLKKLSKKESKLNQKQSYNPFFDDNLDTSSSVIIDNYDIILDEIKNQNQKEVTIDDDDKQTLNNKNSNNVIYIDGTVGGGGHSNALLQYLHGGDIVFGCDVDIDALYTTQQRLSHYTFSNTNSNIDIDIKNKPIFIPVQCNFCDISLSILLQAASNHGGTILRTHVESIMYNKQRQQQQESSSSTDDKNNDSNSKTIPGVDGILLDLGVSSYQIDTPERGFAYRFDGPLDMRMVSTTTTTSTTSTSTSTSTSTTSLSTTGYVRKTGLTAADICNEYDVYDIKNILRTYGDEPRARKIADSIVRHRPLHTTNDLRDAVYDVTPEFYKGASQKRLGRIATLSRTFQSLRIFINQEDIVLNVALQQMIPTVVRSGGRVVVLSYHSMEDRIVKRIFRGDTSIRTGISKINNSNDMIEYNNNNIDKNIDNDTSNNLQQIMYKQGTSGTTTIDSRGQQRRLYFRSIGKKQYATEMEIENNNRARSATLRIGERI